MARKHRVANCVMVGEGRLMAVVALLLCMDRGHVRGGVTMRWGSACLLAVADEVFEILYRTHFEQEPSPRGEKGRLLGDG